MARTAIITDSVADLPAQVVRDLDITVVPLTVHFGDQAYRDGIDISTADFYRRLESSQVTPTTSVPTPGSVAAAYDELAKKTEQIIAVTLSAKLSGTYDVFRQAIELMRHKCRVEVINSGLAIMAEGLIVIAAARAAAAGAASDEILKVIQDTIPRVEFRAAFATLEYLRRGGRIGRAKAMLGSALKINPIITVKDGIVVPVTRKHSRAEAIDYLYRFAEGYASIEEIAIEDSGTNSDGDKLAERLGDIFPREKIYRAHTSPVIGTHTGPSILVLTVQGKRE